MTNNAEKRYLSGNEVLTRFIPGYLPKPILEERFVETSNGRSVEELKNEVLSGLKERLDKLQIEKAPPCKF